MRISKVSNNEYNPNFTAKIKAPEELWSAITPEKLSVRKSKKVYKAFEYLMDEKILPDDTISFSKGLFSKKLIAHSEKNNLDITKMDYDINPFANWPNLIIKTAKTVEKQFVKLSNLADKAKN